MALNASQIEFYRESGYLILENAIDSETLTRIRAKIDEFIQLSRSVESSDAIFDLAPSHSSHSPCVRRLKNPHIQDSLFHDLSRSSMIIDPVAELLGGTVRFDHSKLNFKPPNSDAAIQWHQDWGFYPHTNDDMLAVGVMIEDCTPDNGPMMIIPGSHRGPVYNHHENGIFAGGIDPDELGDLLGEAIDCTAPAGSISIHHVRTLHASRNNATDSTRPLLLYSYMAVDAFPVFDHYEIGEFDSRIIRGAPTLVGRMENLPFRISQPRTKDSDSIFDDQRSLSNRIN